MCAVSVIYDYGRTRVPFDQWNQTTFDSFRDLVRKAEEFDRIAAQPDCEDPAKTAWMREVERRLAILEKTG